MSGYDRAITVFSPDGHLFQVEYALEAVKRGSAAIGIVGKNNEIVLAIEKKSLPQLQDGRTVRKIVQLDDHLTLTFSGLAADSRQLINKARTQCQSHRLQYEEPMSVEQCARFVAKYQQEYTHRGGRRPFGLSTLIAGFDKDMTPRLFMTDPSGTYSEWKARAIGRSQDNVTKVLESLYFEEPAMKEALRDDLPPISMVATTEEQKQHQDNCDPVQLATRVLADMVEREEESIEILKITWNAEKKCVEKNTVSDEVVKQHIKDWKAEKDAQQALGKTYPTIIVDSADGV